MKNFKETLLACLLLAGINAYGADVATVNGVGISEEMLKANILSNLSQGQKDTPELRKDLLEEIINRQLLAQNAIKSGLMSKPDAKLAVDQITQNFEASLAFNEYISQHPVTDTDVRLDYDRQIAALGGSNVQQFKLSMIVVATRIEVDDVIASLKRGGSFESIARARSTAPSKTQGGAIGWMFLAQLPSELAGSLTKLSKGAYTVQPIEFQGSWYVLKVDDKRPFMAPSFEESKDRIRAGLVQQRRAELINELRNSAKISISSTGSAQE